MTDTFTRENLDTMIGSLISDRDRFGNYELEELQDPIDVRSFTGFSDSFVETLNDIFSLMDHEKSPVIILEKTIEMLIARCQITKDDFRAASAIAGGTALPEQQKLFAQRTVLVKTRSHSLLWLTDDMKEKIENVVNDAVYYAR